MYCTKCGAKISSNGYTCLSCGARTFRDGQSSPASRRKLLFLIPSVALILIILLVFALDRGDLQHTTSTNANLLEASNHVQPHTWKAATAEMPTGDLFLLPKADTGFAGSWGGHVRVQANAQDMRNVTTPEIPMSYYFGEQNGVVFLKTSVYGNPKWPVVKSEVKVLNSKSVEIKLDSLCRSCTPPVHQQEISRLTLINAQQLQAESYSYSYATGDGHVELTYKGTSHLLTPDELAALNREVERSGKLLANIDRSSAPP
jgi:hypothetical protein